MAAMGGAVIATSAMAGTVYPDAPASNVVHVGGASAANKNTVLLYQRLCQADNGATVPEFEAPYVFLGESGNQFLVSCRLKADADLPNTGNTRMDFFKESAGGSGGGTINVANSTTLDFMQKPLDTNSNGIPDQFEDTYLNDANNGQAGDNPDKCVPKGDTGTPLPATPWTGSAAEVAAVLDAALVSNTPDPAFEQYRQWEGCTENAVALVPDAGVSDVEPAKTGNPPLDASGVAKLNFASHVATIFGVPVSESLYFALQYVQFPVYKACHPNHPDWLAWRFRRDCMPYLSWTQLRGFFTGQVSDWRALRDSDGEPLPTSAKVPASLQPVPDVSGFFNSYDVRICRRVGTSGTQSTFETQMMHFNCAQPKPLAMVVGPLDATNPTVNDKTFGDFPTWFEAAVTNGETTLRGGGTSNVLRCLQRFETVPGIPEHANLDKKWAIGISSLEKVTGSAFGVGAEYVNGDPGLWHFIGIQDAAPTLLETAEGVYPLYVESTMQWRKADELNAAFNNRLEIVGKVRKDAGLPTIVRQINTAYEQTWGYTGTLALNVDSNNVPRVASWWSKGLGVGVAGDNDGVVTDFDVEAEPILAVTKSPSGITNACQPVLLNGGTETRVSAFWPWWHKWLWCRTARVAGVSPNGFPAPFCDAMAPGVFPALFK